MATYYTRAILVDGIPFPRCVSPGCDRVAAEADVSAVVAPRTAARMRFLRGRHPGRGVDGSGLWCPAEGCWEVLPPPPLPPPPGDGGDGGDGGGAGGAAAAAGADANDGAPPPRTLCPRCGTAACALCGAGAHAGPCARVGVSPAAREAYAVWATGRVGACAYCGAHIQRTGGCDVMRCGACGRDFRYQPFATVAEARAASAGILSAEGVAGPSPGLELGGAEAAAERAALYAAHGPNAGGRAGLRRRQLPQTWAAWRVRMVGAVAEVVLGLVVFGVAPLYTLFARGGLWWLGILTIPLVVIGMPIGLVGLCSTIRLLAVGVPTLLRATPPPEVAAAPAAAAAVEAPPPAVEGADPAADGASVADEADRVPPPPGAAPIADGMPTVVVTAPPATADGEGAWRAIEEPRWPPFATMVPPSRVGAADLQAGSPPPPPLSSPATSPVTPTAPAWSQGGAADSSLAASEADGHGRPAAAGRNGALATGAGAATAPRGEPAPVGDEIV
ncbi:hypothetical protein MMPV_002035 [Pyropia vietnamensis]